MLNDKSRPLALFSCWITFTLFFTGCNAYSGQTGDFNPSNASKLSSDTQSKADLAKSSHSLYVAN